MSDSIPSRVSFYLVSSPVLITGSVSLLCLLGALLLEGPSPPPMGTWGRLGALFPLVLMSILMGLDGIQRVDIGAEGIGVVSLAGFILGRLFRSRPLKAGRTFRLPWSSVDSVELRVSRFQSPLRRAFPRGWLVAGSPGRTVRVPFGHPCFGTALALLRRWVHPYFVHLPSREWEGRIPPRPSLARMLRTIVYDPATPSEFIIETARACLLWGNFSRAERLLDLALAKRESDLKVLDEYYVIMKRLGNLEKARPALQRLLKSRRAPLDLVEMAEVHHAEGEEKEAAERLLQAASEEQTSDLAHFLLGCLYLQREGLVETALDQWKKGLDRARHPHLLGKLVETYRYHRDLLLTPGLLEREHRRHRLRVWSRRLGTAGSCFVLGGAALWWFPPLHSLATRALSGPSLLLFLGGLLMLAAIFLRRRGNS